MSHGMRMEIRSRYITGGAYAGNEVAKAKRRGEIPSAADFDCVDCGSPASVYDHRDYNRPLDIQPVCRSCNKKRGKAIPKIWKEGELQEYMAAMKGRIFGVEKSEFHQRFFSIFREEIGTFG